MTKEMTKGTREDNKMATITISDLSTLIETLESCEEYFDDRADADWDQGRHIPNKEMRLLGEVKEALGIVNRMGGVK